MNSLILASGRSMLRTGLRATGRRARSTATEATGAEAFIKADHSSSSLRLMHKTNIVCMALTPVVFILPDILPASMGGLTTIGNVILGVVFPLHGHIGMAGVLSDYVPKVSKSLLGPSRLVLAGFTTVTILGLLKLNL